MSSFGDVVSKMNIYPDIGACVTQWEAISNITATPGYKLLVKDHQFYSSWTPKSQDLGLWGTVVNGARESVFVFYSSNKDLETLVNNITTLIAHTEYFLENDMSDQFPFEKIAKLLSLKKSLDVSANGITSIDNELDEAFKNNIPLQIKNLAEKVHLFIHKKNNICEPGVLECSLSEKGRDDPEGSSSSQASSSSPYSIRTLGSYKNLGECATQWQTIAGTKAGHTLLVKELTFSSSLTPKIDDSTLLGLGHTANTVRDWTICTYASSRELGELTIKINRLIEVTGYYIDEVGQKREFLAGEVRELSELDRSLKESAKGIVLIDNPLDEKFKDSIPPKIKALSEKVHAIMHEKCNICFEENGPCSSVKAEEATSRKGKERSLSEGEAEKDVFLFDHHSDGEREKIESEEEEQSLSSTGDKTPPPPLPSNDDDRDPSLTSSSDEEEDKLLLSPERKKTPLHSPNNSSDSEKRSPPPLPPRPQPQQVPLPPPLPSAFSEEAEGHRSAAKGKLHWNNISEDRGQLLNQIRGGIGLKHVEQAERPKPKFNVGSAGDMANDLSKLPAFNKLRDVSGHGPKADSDTEEGDNW